MNTPIISIIVPVYNVENYLCPCLDSILAQTYTVFEAILVDDGSSDSSGRICDEYAKKDNRFIVVHKQNEGAAKARITAFENSKGELITFIDADDYVTPDYLEKLVKPILEKNADMVSCYNYDVYSNSQPPKAVKHTIHGLFYGDLLQDFIANHYFYDKLCKGFGMTNYLCTKMIRRKYVAKGLNDGIGMWFGEDQIAMFSMLYKIDVLYILPDYLYYYVHHKGQATQRYDASLWDSLLKMLECYQNLDSRHIATKGLRIRTWLYMKMTIHIKMAHAGVSNNTFVSHLSKVRKHPYMQNFFRYSSTTLGWRDDVKYWMLKLGLLRIFYILFIKSHINDRER